MDNLMANDEITDPNENDVMMPSQAYAQEKMKEIV